MMDSYNAPTSFQAQDAEKRLEKLIQKKATNVTKMMSFKAWWWRRKARWQRWCRTQSSSEASSAEVANAKSLHASGYRKSILDVVTSECASTVLEAAEKKRQSLGLKTVGRGPSAADRSEKQSQSVAKAREVSADAIQGMQKPYLAVTANLMLTTSKTHTISLELTLKTPTALTKKIKQKRKVNK